MFLTFLTSAIIKVDYCKTRYQHYKTYLVPKMAAKDNPLQ